MTLKSIGLTMGKVKPITEIFLRVRGELGLLTDSLIHCDKKGVLVHRVTLNKLLRELETSLGFIDKTIIISTSLNNYYLEGIGLF